MIFATGHGTARSDLGQYLAAEGQNAALYAGILEKSVPDFKQAVRSRGVPFAAVTGAAGSQRYSRRTARPASVEGTPRGKW